MDHHHRSCVLPSNAPALPESADAIPSRVLQERSANRRHGYADDASTWKRSSSPGENVYSSRLGGYFTGNVGGQVNGEKSEAQIEYETKRLLNLLHRCEKYEKYRARQPQTAKDREQRWPDHLEEAFFRGLVRWPPMGRRKHMLDGQLRGRNELVADSIERDTGEPRTRKQVSSHIQVLKNILKEQPQILVYMSTEDMGGRRNRHGNAHYGHLRSRHQSSKYDWPQGGSGLYHGLGHLPSSLALAKIQAGQDDAPYTVDYFSMCVRVEGQPVHTFSQLSPNSRQPDLTVSDTTSWHKQYPEFNFHRTDELKRHHVLACDATIKIMTMERPHDAELDINFQLRSQVDLSTYDSLECRTRFFEAGKPAYQFDEHKRKVKETRTEVQYLPKHGGYLRLRFGASFWAQQLQRLSHMLRKAGEEEQNSRVKYESQVRNELQYMTAAQDVYGVKDGVATCVLTVLWRFHQTRASHEAGRVTWRNVDFGRRERRRAKEEVTDSRHSVDALLPMASNASSTIPSISASSNSMYPSLPLDFHSQPFSHHPPPLDLDALGLDSISSDFSHPSSATAPNLAPEYNQTHSLPSITHCQDMSMSQAQSDYPDTNEFEFNNGQITIPGCLEPAINMGAYDSFGSQPAHGNQALNSIHSIAGLEHHNPHQHHHDNDGFGDLALGVSMAGCYATKPSWHHPSLISHLENAAEAYSDLVGMQSSGGHVENSMSGVDVGHGVLHGLGHDGGIWKLQSAFGEDTGVGAHDGVRKDSVAGRVEDSHGQSLLDFMERSRSERYRPY